MPSPIQSWGAAGKKLTVNASPCILLNPVLEDPRASTVVTDRPSRLPKGVKQELMLVVTDSPAPQDNA